MFSKTYLSCTNGKSLRAIETIEQVIPKLKELNSCTNGKSLRAIETFASKFLQVLRYSSMCENR